MPTNVDRAARASAAVECYVRLPGIASVEASGIHTTLQDLLTDMMHLANQELVNWREVFRMAEDTYEAEKDEAPHGGRKDWDPRRG